MHHFGNCVCVMVMILSVISCVALGRDFGFFSSQQPRTVHPRKGSSTSFCGVRRAPNDLRALFTQAI
jgi:hypothetical protein